MLARRTLLRQQQMPTARVAVDTRRRTRQRTNPRSAEVVALVEVVMVHPVVQVDLVVAVVVVMKEPEEMV